MKHFLRKDGLADLIDGISKIRNQSRTFWSEGIDRKSDTNSQVQKVPALFIRNPILHSLLLV